MAADRFEIEITYANNAQRDELHSAIQDEIMLLAARIRASNQFNKISIKEYHNEE